MKREHAAALVCGLLFALGLGISGMTQPAKVVGFLDFFGKWDPSLAFVMMGAIAVYAIGYRLVVKRPRPLAHEAFHIPPMKAIDRRLIAGSIVFGVGWGLAGFCPGPAIVSMASLQVEPLVFTVAMTAGMLLFRRVHS